MWRIGQSFRRVPWLVGLSLALLNASASLLYGQARDLRIAGSIRDTLGRPIPGAEVVAARVGEPTAQRGTTDSSGQVEIIIRATDGPVSLFAAAPGYAPLRRLLQASELGRDFALVLKARVTNIAPLKVVARAPVAETSAPGDLFSRPGGGEQTIGMMRGGQSTQDAGSATGIAATLSYLGQTSDGITLLGAPSSQGAVTLDGVAVGVGRVPRSLPVIAKAITGVVDVAVGGVNGAIINISPAAADREIAIKSVEILTTPGALGSDRRAQFGGVRNSVIGVSTGFSGPMLDDRLGVNAALQVQTTYAPQPDPLTADSATLNAGGLSRIQIGRIDSIARQVGIPSFGAYSASQTSVLGIARIDRLNRRRGPLSTTISVEASTQTFGGGLLVGQSTRASEQTASLRAVWNATQLPQGGQRWLIEHRGGVGFAWLAQRGVSDLPLVMVSSTNSAATVGAIGGAVIIGGTGLAATRDARVTMEDKLEAQWRSWNGRHTIKVVGWLRAELLQRKDEDQATGALQYASIEDFATGRPTQFSRYRGAISARAATWSVATGIGDLYAPSRWFKMYAGFRVEGTGDAGRSPYASLQASSPWLDGTRPVSAVAISPRLAVEWWSLRKPPGWVQLQSDFASAVREPLGILRLSAGRFQGTMSSDEAMRVAAAPRGESQRQFILCNASNSSSLANGGVWPGSVPDSCLSANGSTVGTSAVESYARAIGWRPPASWRAQLGYQLAAAGLRAQIDARTAWNTDQPFVIDQNLRATAGSLLSAEGNRPLLVPLSTIDPTTGYVSTISARLEQGAGRQVLLQSGLKSGGYSFTVQASPQAPLQRGRALASVSYTYARTWREQNGFAGSTNGLPSLIERGPASEDQRHTLVAQAGFHIGAIVVSAAARVASGRPFTPLVRGDINGDGLQNDRAYIFAAQQAVDTALGEAIRNLQESAPASIRECVTGQIGRVAGLGSCREPWTATTNLRVELGPRVGERTWRNRVRVAASVENALGAIDAVLHPRNPRGWGGPSQVDPYLLVPRAYATTTGYQYNLNQRFGQPGPQSGFLQSPYRVSFECSVDFSDPRDQQVVDRISRDISRADTRVGRGADRIRAVYVDRMRPLYERLLLTTDSIAVSTEQSARLEALAKVFYRKLDTLWTPVGEQVAAMAASSSNAGMASLIERTDIEMWDVLWRETAEQVLQILTPPQLAAIEPGIREMLLRGSSRNRIYY